MLILLQASKIAKGAYIAGKAYQQGWFDSLLESPIFWIVVIVGIIVLAACAWEGNKH